MLQYPNITLQVFAKTPVLNTVKTRLQPDFSPEFSKKLHCALVDYCLHTWQNTKLFALELWLAGDETVFTQNLPQWQNLAIKQQQGQDLGERLLYASQSCLSHKKTDGVILVGTDCPFIDAHYLKSACAALADYDVVIGGADDGGYVLLAFKQSYKELFVNIDWGSEQVYAQTLYAINKKKLSCFELPVLSDIDRPGDIQKLKSIPAFSEFV